MGLDALGNLGSEHITLSETVYRAIREAIIDHRLAPGRQLRSADLSEVLGVSRTPINEALFRLRQEGLVTYSERHGFSVVRVSAPELPDLFDARVMCEVYGVQRGLASISDADSANIKSVTARLESLAQSPGTSGQWYATEYSIHRSIVSLAQNPITTRWHERITGIINSRWAPVPTSEAPNVNAPSVNEHKGILDALLARDIATVEKLIRQHADSEIARLASYIRSTEV
jgi:GntR family transcriptional regulator, carbon starvation induced regulator